MPINRKNQIEGRVLRRLVRRLKGNNVSVTASVRGLLKDELRTAAMVGASEERSRTLRLLREHGGRTEGLIVKITSRGVLDVLGYTEKPDG